MADKLDRTVVRTATALVVGALAVVFDTTILSVALHTLATDLHTTVAQIQWVTTGYLLALAATVPLSAWCLARFGGKRVWMAALAIFLAGSILSGLAWNAESLIAFRVFQGVGGGLMLPVMTTMVMEVAGGRQLGRVSAVIGLPAMAGPVLGPVLGGLILALGDWRWIFWVNIPFSVAGLLLAWRMLPADRGRDPKRRLDLVGVLLLVPGLAGLLLGLSDSVLIGGFGRLDAWLPLVAGAALVAAFVWWALRQRGAALVDVRLLRVRSVWSASTLLFLSSVALYGAMLLLPLFFQQVRGTDALGAGLLLVPQGLGTLACRPLAGRLIDRVGARWIALAGFAIVAVSTVPFALSPASAADPLLLVALFIRGFGLGAITMPLMVASYQGLAGEQIAHSSILTRTAQQLGGSFGTALFAVLLQAAVEGGASLSGAFDLAFWVASGATLLGVGISFVLPSAKAVQAQATAPAAPTPAAVTAASGSPRPAP
ncbi:MDR family MFS transporter [Leifsonia shinshuensis]|uniref:MDR family MFS transporter n=1 Tax=Leifsonia shinshuensis TaxID=150026 RepID=UPI002156545C|nr:MDR family MFS transporter [Leifsonia shinshuensis]